MKLFKNIFITAVQYGYEIWTSNSKINKRVEILEMKGSRYI